MLRSLLEKLVGTTTEKTIKKLKPTVAKINALEEHYQKLTDAELQAKTAEFKERIAGGEPLDKILPEAFAVVKNACRRLVGQSWEVRGTPREWLIVPYDTQLLGGMVLHHGNIAEMKTGEGKTLVCTFPLYLNALTGKGVHLITVNNYLASRDSEWMGGLFRFLGLTVAVIEHGMSTAERKAAYAADIVYGTNTEFGFDYLRDNMARNQEEVVQRDLNFAIVDEVDSILIDEARTPLIISAAADESTEKYESYATLIPTLVAGEDYTVDEKAKAASLSESGIKKLEEKLGAENLFADVDYAEVHHIEQALKAHAVYHRDKDYVVTPQGEIMIVDEFTGRLMPGRRYSDGLHQALEAKERVVVQRESKTLATVTLQNYFRLYHKLAGMTGTAETEAEEFAKIYALETVVVPTHRPVARVDMADRVYKNEKGKFDAVIATITELHTKGQPVLVGTTTIEKSERVAALLARQNIPHTVLNAKQHEKEAEIIARAGEKGAVTIATNMAGRGTDIKLGDGVQELGGLFVLATERHESRRIDNQLRGRSGRQGDAGSSQFYVSMEDTLMRLFGGEKLQAMMNFLKVPDDMPIENTTISKSIENAQKKVEAYHFDTRKHLVQYDDVLNKHREIIYTRRRKLLKEDDIKDEITNLIPEYAASLITLATLGREVAEWDITTLATHLTALTSHTATPLSTLEKLDTIADLTRFTQEFLESAYRAKETALPDPTILRHVERQIYLSTIDRLWMEHLENMRYLREKVAFHGYGQRDPLIEYRSEGYTMFEELITNIRSNTLEHLFKTQIQVTTTLENTAFPAQIITNAENIESALLEADIASAGTAAVLPEALPSMAELLTPHTAISPMGTSGITVIKADDAFPTAASTTPHSDPIIALALRTGVTRNDPCPCGSGQKFKKCHGVGL